jgi:peptidoglycan hydrolase-like protein with peptidoglycan-binding domain
MRNQLNLAPAPFPAFSPAVHPNPFADEEWAAEEGEISRSSPDYIKWVQISLNKLLGLRLAVDGISGPATRSAVRAFQGQKGLAVDGIVGPITEAALVAAGAGNPPGGAAPGYGPPAGVPATPGDSALRIRLARQILAHPGISLATSSSTPNGNPRQNIIDSSNGRPATSGCYDFSKCGSTVYLSTKMLQALLNLAKAGNTFYVTAFTGGQHSSGSDHYAGRAVDLGMWNGVSLSSPSDAHTAARNALISVGSNPDQTFNAYHDTSKHEHQNHVHGAFY